MDLKRDNLILDIHPGKHLDIVIGFNIFLIVGLECNLKERFINSLITRISLTLTESSMNNRLADVIETAVRSSEGRESAMEE